VPFLHFNGLSQLDGITHAVTTRRGPAFGQVGTDQATAEAASQTADLLCMQGTAWAHQVHGDTILQVSQPGLAGQADGLFTETPGLLVAGRSADCPIVLVAGKRKGGAPVVGFAHASWRSTVKEITTRLIEAMNALPETLHAAIAPSAGPCCYEIGDEVRDQALQALGSVAERHFARGQRRWHFDLWSANTAQLIAAGVPGQRIENPRICTICQGEDFWSWRVQQEQAGRFAGVIGVSQVPCQIPPNR
jgi:purine-nucleoside/S-methyl-5'-thioadenosine phosphorylase / adenosine deaminase